MPREVTTTRTVYKFDELSQDAQQRALEKLYDINSFDDWYEFVFDWFADPCSGILEPLETGLEYVSCSFTGFSHQGQGASIEFQIDDVKKYANWLLNKYPERDAKEQAKNLRILRRYLKWAPDSLEHDGYTSKQGRGFYYQDYAPIDFSPNENWNQPIKYLKHLCDVLNDASETHKHYLDREAFAMLEREYDSLHSEDAIKEAIDANEYEFDADGRIAQGV
jgi:hypothetical protein